MIRTLKEWREFCAERGTSGDMVYDILNDWEEFVKRTEAVFGVDYELSNDSEVNND